MIAYLESKTRQLLANSFILKRYKGMKKIFIGIDFSKEKFDATLIKAEYDTYQVPVIWDSLTCSPKLKIEKRKSVAASVSSCLGFVGRFIVQPLSSVRS